MAILRKINSRLKAEINTGFGVNSSDYGGRFVNKNGRANIEKKGIGFFEKISWYHTMLLMPRWKFFSVIILFYVVTNLFFGECRRSAGSTSWLVEPCTGNRTFIWKICQTTCTPPFQ